MLMDIWVVSHNTLISISFYSFLCPLLYRMGHTILVNRERSDSLFYAHSLHQYPADSMCSVSIHCNCVLFAWPNLPVLLEPQKLWSIQPPHRHHFHFQHRLFLATSHFFNAELIPGSRLLKSPFTKNLLLHFLRAKGAELNSRYGHLRYSSYLNIKM